MRKTGWELPEPALQAEYKVQAHSWKELPGQREGAGPEPKVCAATLLGGGVGRTGRPGKGGGTNSCISSLSLNSVAASLPLSRPA